MNIIKPARILFSLLLILTFAACTAQPSETSASSDAEENSVVLFTIEGAQTASLTRAEFLAIEQCTHHINRTNSKGETTSGDYTGVKWDALAKAIGVPDNVKSVTLIASDGYSQAYTPDIFLADQSIFAIEMDGAPITQETKNGQVWFCADESYTANYWTKFITRIVIDGEETK